MAANYIYTELNKFSAVCRFYYGEKFPHNKSESNAAYTVLAVNNLQYLAEALEDLIKKATETTANLVGFDGADILDKSIDAAKEALKRIS